MSVLPQTLMVKNIQTGQTARLAVTRWWGWEKIRAEVLKSCERLGIKNGVGLLAVLNEREAKIFDVHAAPVQVQPGVFNTAPVVGQVLLWVEDRK